MTDQEIKIREIEERIKKLEDVVFNQWLGQYQMQPKIDWLNNDWRTNDSLNYDVGYTGPVSKYNPESMRDRLEHASVEHKEILDYLKDK